MTSPQQFIESFLRQKAGAYAEANARLAPLFKEHFGDPLSKRTGDFLMRDVSGVVFDEVKESENSAVAITRAPNLKDRLARTRYELSAANGSWKIVRIEHECFFCQGTGRSGTNVCHECNGKGWGDYHGHKV
jgi:DnaJ-class molecular chaperone